MTDVSLRFAPFSVPRGGVAIAFCDLSLSLAPTMPSAIDSRVAYSLRAAATSLVAIVTFFLAGLFSPSAFLVL
jgi:hypothetical protein